MSGLGVLQGLSLYATLNHSMCLLRALLTGAGVKF
jgi:hypothetical protein